MILRKILKSTVGYSLWVDLALCVLALASIKANAQVRFETNSVINSGGAGVQRVKVISANGYVIAEVVDDLKVHIEMSAKLPGPAVETAIATSPLVQKTSYTGATSFKVIAKNGFETAKLRVEFDTTTLCVSFKSLADNNLLNRTCPADLDKGTKFLKLDSPTTTNVYGLGQYMSGDAKTNSDWIGKVWEPGPFGNMMRGFHNGATANTQIPIAYFLGAGRSGHAIFYDNFYRQKWDFTARPWTLETWGDQQRFYFMLNDSLANLRRDYMDLTGRPPMPSRQLFGLWASEFGYDNWQEIYQNIDSLQHAGFPLDGLALDLQWYGTKFNDPDASTMGSLRWDQGNFPDPEKHVKNLRGNFGLQLLMIEQPYISSAIPEYSLLNSQGLMVKDCKGCPATFITYSTWWGRGGYLDFTNPETNRFWHNEKRSKLIDLGIYGHWTDLGEPEMYHTWAWYYGLPQFDLHAHGDVHNLYAMMWLEGIYKGYRDNNINHRPIILSRSGNAGVQRYDVAMWSGDIGANLPSLQAQIRNQMQMSLSGIDYYGSDVGGFYRAAGDGHEQDLYSMWFANSALFETPVRVHVWNLDNKNSSLPSRIGNRDSNLQNIRNRYELIPYYYSLAYQAHKNAEPVIGPMVYHWQEDQNLRTIADQKTIGKSLMGALITDYESSGRSVYLPKGRWFDYYNHEAFDSNGQSLKEYPLFRKGRLTLPLFARAGAILPKMKVPEEMINAFGRTLADKIDSTLVLRVYPDSTASSFDFYEDDGGTFDYEKGGYQTTTIEQQQSAGQVKITVNAAVGNFAAALKQRAYEIELVHAADVLKDIVVNGAAVDRCKDSDLKAAVTVAKPCYDPAQTGMTRVYFGVQNTAVTKTLVATLQKANAESARALFVCDNAKTLQGQSVYITGNIAELGRWDADRAFLLEPNRYPSWSAYIENLPPSEKIEWKCLIKDNGSVAKSPTKNVVVWQSGENNILQTGDGFSGASHGAMP